MRDTEKATWIINLENATVEAVGKMGKAAVIAVFRRYDATDLSNLQECFYSEVFCDIEAMITDD